MESNQIHTEPIVENKPPSEELTEFCPKLDWKFQTVVFMGNNFSTTLSIEPFTAVELELSLKNPKLDPLCLNILYKLLMKKAFFKPNIKVTDWETKDKLQQLLIKKLNYFYKLYSRILNQKYGIPFSTELIELDLKQCGEKESFDIMKAEDYYGEIEFEPDLKKLMVLNFFRGISGLNPLVSQEFFKKRILEGKRSALNPSTGNNAPSMKEKTYNVDVDDNENKFVININDNMSNGNSKEKVPSNKEDGRDKDSSDDDLSLKEEGNKPSKKGATSKNEDSDSEDLEEEFNEGIDGKGKSINPENRDNADLNYNLIDTNIKEDDFGHLLNFEDFTLKQKVEVLYFFFLYSIEFSGRTHYFKHEALENSKLSVQSNFNEAQENPSVSIQNNYKEIVINRQALNPYSLRKTNSSMVENMILSKENRILGMDNEENTYSLPLVNKSCIIFKDSQEKSAIETVCKNYSEIERLLENLEKQRQSSNNSNINNIDLDNPNNSSTKRQSKAVAKKTRSEPVKEDKTIKLTTNIKDLLLTFKEFDEEERKKEANYHKKAIISSKNASQGKEYVLMNMTEHITTRRQLNKLAEEAIPVFNGSSVNPSSYKRSKNKEPSYEDIKKMRIEQQNQEREKRMQERNKEMKSDRADYLAKKRGNSKKGRINYYEDYEQEELTESYRREPDTEQPRGLKIRIKTTDSASNSKEIPSRESSEDKYSEYKLSQGYNTESINESYTSEYGLEQKSRIKKNDRRKKNPDKAERNYRSNHTEGLHTKDDENSFEDEFGGIDENFLDTEIQMDCSLIYRYSLNQLEIVGNWGMSSDSMNEKMSYLFSRTSDKQRIFVKKNEVDYEDIQNQKNEVFEEKVICKEIIIEEKEKEKVEEENNNSSKENIENIGMEIEVDDQRKGEVNKETSEMIIELNHPELLKPVSEEQELTSQREESKSNEVSNTIFNDFYNNPTPEISNPFQETVSQELEPEKIQDQDKQSLNNVTHTEQEAVKQEEPQPAPAKIKKKPELLFYTSKDLENFEPVDICVSNLHELILINHNMVINEVLKFLSSDYCGYFVYFSKTIEDKFTLTLNIEDSSLISVEGEGINSLGRFKVKGYMNLFRDKFDLIRNNDLEEDFIRIAKIKMTRQYLVFNPNENERVMKSFTHRKRKKEDMGEFIYGVSYNQYGLNRRNNSQEIGNVGTGANGIINNKSIFDDDYEFNEEEY